MTTTAHSVAEISRQEQIALLNDRVRLGLDPKARIVVTRNCLDQLAEAPGAPEEGFALQAMLFAAFRDCTFSEDSPERDFAAITFLDRKVWFKIDLYEETVVKNTFCVSFPVRLPAPLPSYSDSIDWLRSFRGQLMHNPCIDLYPVEAEAAYHNPYSHPRIEQRRMRTKLLLGVFRRHQSSRSRIAPTRVALLSLLQHRHQTARSSAPCGTSPVSTKRQSAISNFRASATIPTLAARPPFPLKRLRYQTANSLLG